VYISSFFIIVCACTTLSCSQRRPKVADITVERCINCSAAINTININATLASIASPLDFQRIKPVSFKGMRPFRNARERSSAPLGNTSQATAPKSRTTGVLSIETVISVISARAIPLTLRQARSSGQTQRRLCRLSYLGPRRRHTQPPVHPINISSADRSPSIGSYLMERRLQREHLFPRDNE